MFRGSARSEKDRYMQTQHSPVSSTKGEETEGFGCKLDIENLKLLTDLKKIAVVCSLHFIRMVQIYKKTLISVKLDVRTRKHFKKI